MSIENGFNKQSSAGFCIRRLSMVAAAVVALAFTADKMTGPDPDGCDAEIVNPASWVVCPVVDGGSAITRMTLDAFTAEVNRGIP